MKRDSLTFLRCPYTGSAFVPAVDSADDEETEFGVVVSEAGEFPIVAGVLRLLLDDLRGPLLELVRSGRHQEALAAALDVPFLDRRGILLQGLWRRVLRRRKQALGYARGPGKAQTLKLAASAAAFSAATAATGAASWASWQTYRFSMPTFLPVYPLVHLARGSRSIFDFGCGLGQSSFLLSRVAPTARIVCGDFSFTAMHLARRYFVPQATCICLDGDYPLPFVAQHFDHVFSTDAMQYIGPKIGLAREFERVLAPGGTIALAHLHNRLSPERGCTGTGLTPQGYLGLFDGMTRRLYPEAVLVGDYFGRGLLDLEREYRVADASEWLSGVSMIATATTTPLSNLTGLLDEAVALAREPRVNPVYTATRTSPTTWALERRVDAPFAVERRVGDHEILPRRAEITAAGLDSASLLALRGKADGGLRELMRRGIVLDLPTRFLPPAAEQA